MEGRITTPVVQNEDNELITCNELSLDAVGISLNKGTSTKPLSKTQ
jgi:hypothetical protein